MRTTKQVLLFLLFLWLVTACSNNAPRSNSANPSQATPCPTPGGTVVTCKINSDGTVQPTPASLGQVGPGPAVQPAAIQVEMSLDNLDASYGSLVFTVALIGADQKLDLSQYGTLTSDLGLTVKASAWKAVAESDRIQGKLSFPAILDGKPVLQGAKKFTVSLKNIGAQPETFTFNVP